MTPLIRRDLYLASSDVAREEEEDEEEGRAWKKTLQSPQQSQLLRLHLAGRSRPYPVLRERPEPPP